METELHQIKIKDEQIFVLVPRSLGFKHLEEDPLKIVFSNGDREDAVIYENGSGEKICVPKDMKGLLGI